MATHNLKLVKDIIVGEAHNYSEGEKHYAVCSVTLVFEGGEKVKLPCSLAFVLNVQSKSLMGIGSYPAVYD